MEKYFFWKEMEGTLLFD